MLFVYVICSTTRLCNPAALSLFVYIAKQHGLTVDMITTAANELSVPAKYRVSYLLVLGNTCLLWGGLAMGVPHDYVVAKCHFGLKLNLYFDAYTQK